MFVWKPCLEVAQNKKKKKRNEADQDDSNREGRKRKGKQSRMFVWKLCSEVAQKDELLWPERTSPVKERKRSKILMPAGVRREIKEEIRRN